jgi:hypothetical protein
VTVRIKKDLGPSVTPLAIPVAMLRFSSKNTGSGSRSIDLSRPPRTTAFHSVPSVELLAENSFLGTPRDCRGHMNAIAMQVMTSKP